MSWVSDVWDSAKDTAVTWSTGGLNKVYESGKDAMSPDYNDDQYASKTRARLAREQWEDYKKRIQPYEDELVAMAFTGPEGQTLEGAPASVAWDNYKSQGPEGGMVGQADRQARSQFDTGLEVAGRQRQRYGMSGPSESTQRQNKLARGLSVVGARNNARDDWEQQRRGILTGMGGR